MGEKLNESAICRRQTRLDGCRRGFGAAEDHKVLSSEA
jgi:hypothetical protein